MLAKRVAIAYLLLVNKYTYREISKTLKISLGTIAKVHATFALKGEGYRNIIGNLVTNKNIKNLLSFASRKEIADSVIKNVRVVSTRPSLLCEKKESFRKRKITVSSAARLLSRDI